MKRTVNSVAPIRICDLGGWTDTWFAKRGAVLNFGVYPYVQCQLCVSEARGGKGHFTIHAENYGDRYPVDPQAVALGRHPLLEACVAAMNIPSNLDIEANLYSQIPGGSSTGTSAAITVALIGALDVLTPGRMEPAKVAMKAHEVETDYLHLQSGIQDQLAAVSGGISYIDMREYPHSTVTRIELPNPLWWEIESRLCLFYLGNPHNSSDVHRTVITRLENEPGDDTLDELRRFPALGRDALLAGDLPVFGQIMKANTRAQSALHPALVSDEAKAIFEIADRHGALGWKINGAGGDGGSVTIFGPAQRERQRKMTDAILRANPSIREIPTYLSRYGLRVWESENNGVFQTRK